MKIKGELEVSAISLRFFAFKTTVINLVTKNLLILENCEVFSCKMFLKVFYFFFFPIFLALKLFVFLFNSRKKISRNLKNRE